MFTEKRNEFMANIRRKNRMKTINRRRMNIQPGSESQSSTLEADLDKYAHLQFNELKDQLINLIELVENSDESFEVPLTKIKELITSNSM